MNRVQIAVVGHDIKNFPKIHNPVLKPALLGNLQYSKDIYASNSLAESRFFLANNFFDDYAQIVGCLSASWDKKYFPNKLNNINYWPQYIKYYQDLLYNQNTVLCATMCFGNNIDRTTVPLWFTDFQKHFRKNWTNSEWVEDLIFKITGYRYDNKNIAPYSNQIICNKILFNKLSVFIRNIIDDVIDKFGLSPKITGKEIDKNRTLAYVMEEITMLWWSKQDNINYVQCGKIIPGWYK